MIKIFKQNKTKNGYATLELLFYIAFFVLLSLVVIDAMMVMAKSFKETSIQAELLQSGTIMEGISRELRQANDFSFASNVLTVNTEDDSGNPKTITYALSNSRIQITDSVAGSLGNLNTPNIAVMNFNLVTITTAKGKAAEISLTVKSNNDRLERTADFNNTVVLRGSY